MFKQGRAGAYCRIAGKLSTVIFCFAVLLGCVTSSSIITGTVRPAISPAEVKIYIDPPLQYETIGLIEASSDVEVSAQAAQDRVIEELKKQAAKIGANGILLINFGSQSSDTVGVYSNGVVVTSSAQTKIIHARAIYVTE